MHQDWKMVSYMDMREIQRMSPMIAFIPLYCMTTFEKHATNIQMQDFEWPAREFVVVISS